VSIDVTALFAFCDLHVTRVCRSWDDMIRLPDLGSELSWPRYFDRQGFPIPMVDGVDPTLVWARMKRNHDDTIVAVDELPDGSRLSTVWLGLDHGLGGPPLIFETMRFARDVTETHWRIAGKPRTFPDPFGEPGDTTDQLRYTTEEEALAAHHEIVRRIVVREGH
jgi:hypothetical protein